MRRVPAAGAVIRDELCRVLLILRGRPPDAGRWSIPGGRVEPGESLPQAAAREAFEETGLRVRVGELLGELDIPGADADTVYVVSDYAAAVVGGELRPGDDAADARWCTRAEAAALPLTTDLLDYLDRYGAFDPPAPGLART